MSTTPEHILRLVLEGAVRVSEHGYDKLPVDGILARQVTDGAGPRVVGRGVPEEKAIQKRVRTKLVHEGMYLAEVDVELLETADEWFPYLSLDDAYKLDNIREALRRGDVKSSSVEYSP